MAHKLGDLVLACRLRELARQCSEANEPSRDIDIQIFIAMSPRASIDYWAGDPRIIPYYTGSLDSAASLIPEGFDWVLERTNDGLTISSRVGHNDPDKSSWGNSVSLALCAGALSAQAKLLVDKGSVNKCPTPM